MFHRRVRCQSCGYLSFAGTEGKAEVTRDYRVSGSWSLPECFKGAHDLEGEVEMAAPDRGSEASFVNVITQERRCGQHTAYLRTKTPAEHQDLALTTQRDTWNFIRGFAAGLVTGVVGAVLKVVFT